MTTDLVFKGENGQAITNSLLVAEKFEKKHKHVLEAINKIMTSAENSAVLEMFEKTTYLNEQNKAQPMFLMNRDGFTLLAMGFTGKKAFEFKLAYITAFNQMEDTIRNSQRQIANVPQTFSQALHLAAMQQEEIERQHLLIEQKTLENKEQALQIHTLTNAVAEMQEKVSYLDKILECKGTVTVTQIAQDYGMSAKHFNSVLEQLRIQRKVNKQWILYAENIGKGYVHSKAVDITHKNGSKDITYNTEWTQKGRLFLYEELKKNDYIPLIEQ